jgi:hypothetical protein
VVTAHAAKAAADKARTEAHLMRRERALFLRALGHPVKKDGPMKTEQFDDEVLTFPQWCELNTLSTRSGRRILAGEYGPPPEIVQLTPHRIGITRGANRAWQQKRIDGGTK